MDNQTCFRFSKPVATNLYSNELFRSTFTPRINTASSVADEASEECRNDIKGFIQGKLRPGTVGSAAGNGTALLFPEASPERLRIVSYFVEMATIYSDLLEASTSTEMVHPTSRRAMHNDGIVEVNRINQLACKGVLPSTRVRHLDRAMFQAVMAKSLLDIFRVDTVLGKQLMAACEDLYSSKSTGQDVKFQDLDEYLKCCASEHGDSRVWVPVLKFASNNCISSKDLSSISHITELAILACALWNDYSSWEKEFEDFKSDLERDGRARLANAVHILMQLHQVSPTAAKSLLQEEILKVEELFKVTRREHTANNSLSAEVVAWFDSLEWLVAGNALYGFSAPRYRELSQNATSNKYTAPEKPDKEMIERPLASVVIYKEWSKSLDVISKEGSPELSERRVKNSSKFWSDEALALSSKCESTTGRTAIDSIAVQPWAYMAALPVTGTMDKFIDGLNVWYHVPEKQFSIIKHVHSAIIGVILMGDDIADQSPIRRKHPSTNLVYGLGQTINSAIWAYGKVLESVLLLSGQSVKIFLEEMDQIQIGQAHDIHWTYNCKCPSLEEYIHQAEQKTGGIFRMASRMVQAEATKNVDLDTTAWVAVFGRFAQIFDDYTDISIPASNVGTSNYDDLDEGAFTLPIIHAFNNLPEVGRLQLMNILQSRKENGVMSKDMKKLAMRWLERAGSLDFTRQMLENLLKDVNRELEVLEKKAGGENWIFRLMMCRFK